MSLSLPIVRLQIPWPGLPREITVESSHFTLEIPLGIPRQNAKYPRKFLLYIAWAVYGQQGKLSLLDGSSLVDANMSALELAENEMYTFFPAGDDCTLCDIRGGDDRTSIHSEDNARVSNIRDQISERDGHRCVLVDLPTPPSTPANIYLPMPQQPPSTLAPLVCEAMHILPHSKGDEYMESVFTTRQHTDQWGETTGEDSVIKTIDDPRNMIFFERALHPGMKTGQFAFLVVPNAVLSLDDIYVDPKEESTPDPNLPNVQWQIMDPLFYQVYTFTIAFKDERVWNNKFLRLPQDLTSWPTFVIWHFWYGYSALQNWLKDGAAKSVLEEVMQEDYYANDGGEFDPESQDHDPRDGADGAKKANDGNGQQGEATHHGSSAPNYNLDLLSMMWKFSRPKVVEDVSASHKRVADWVQQTAVVGV